MPDRAVACAELLVALAGNPKCTLPEIIAEAAVAGLDRIGISGSESATFEWEEEDRQLLAPEFIENLFRSLQVFKNGTLCEAAAVKIAARPETFSPVTSSFPQSRGSAGRAGR